MSTSKTSTWVKEPGEDDLQIFVGVEAAKTLPAELLAELEALATKLAKHGGVQPELTCPLTSSVVNAPRIWLAQV